MQKSDFNTSIQTLKKAIRHQWLGQTGMLGLMTALTICAIVFFIQYALQFPLNSLLVYPLLLILAFTSTIFYKWKFRKRFEEELGMLDRRFNLKEQLRTAYEIQQTGKVSFLAEKLIESAGWSLKNINFHQLYPHHYSRSLIAVCLLTSSFFVIPHLPKVRLGLDYPNLSEEIQSKPSQSISLKLENLAETRKIHKSDAVEKNALEERVKQFSENNRRNDFADLKSFKELRLLKKEVKDLKQRNAREFYSQISPDVASEIPSLEEFLEEGFSQEDVKIIEQELERTFQRETPGKALQELSNLLENQKWEEMLNELSGQEQTEGTEKKGLLQETPGSKNGEMDKEGKQYMTERDYDGGEDDFDFMMREDSPHRPGEKPGTGSRKTPSSPRRSENQISKISGPSGTGKRHSVTVQTLTTIGSAEVKEETTIRSYDQDLESTFQKEQIPLHYQQFIKNYFLSIDDRKKNAEQQSR
ncbi:MAG: hypothetical protein HQM13_22595 [SAR324 cluster bacterium]|nr:hypothetical protein [SAR324 cluster bacterium]